jgi:hypothetical protein
MVNLSRPPKLIDDDDDKPDSGNIQCYTKNIRRDSGNILRDSDDDDDNRPIWPTWAVGALFRDARRIHINRVCFHTTVRMFSQFSH